MKLAIYSEQSIIYGSPRGVIAELDARVARTPTERASGFARQPSIQPNEAIFFAFLNDMNTPFTMADTLFNLDMLFIDRNGHAVCAIHNAQARDTQLYSCGAPYRYVIEVPAGWLQAHGILGEASVGWNPRDIGQIT